MADTTGAPWNIPFPTTGDLVPPFESKFAVQATALHTALDLIRKSTSVPVANQAERNSLFASPTQGDRVWRKDLGYEETYYAVYNATNNPGGVSPAGWYPSGAVGWIEPSLNSNWNGYAGETVRWRKFAGFLVMNGRVTGQPNAGTTIFTLPDWARPRSADAPVFSVHSDNGPTIIQVGQNGAVVCASRQGQARQGVSLAGIIIPVES